VHAAIGISPYFEWLYDRSLIRRRYRDAFGKYPDLKAPKTFSEKIIYKRLYDRRPILTQVTDKILMRDYVQARVDSKYLSEIYQIANSPEEIDWPNLPSSFVLKTNHGCKWNIFVPDKEQIDRAAVTRRLSSWLDTNYYRHTREWAYRNIPPLVFAEEMLDGENGRAPFDWKFFCFLGKPLYVQVDFDRFGRHRRNLYDRHLVRLNVKYARERSLVDPVFPSNMSEMFELANRLAQDFDFIRVDLYNINGRIVVGELTNYPEAGLAPFEPDAVDRELGDQWELRS
jgi:hypothetical protein